VIRLAGSAPALAAKLHRVVLDSIPIARPSSTQDEQGLLGIARCARFASHANHTVRIHRNRFRFRWLPRVAQWVLDGSRRSSEGQKVSDSYMSNLVADRVDLALDKMEPQFLQAAGGKTKAEAALQDLFNYCGRPLESELRHEETGFFLGADGRRAPMRGFYYSGRTTQHPKGVCFFAVNVVPGENGMKVVSFGPLKLLTGQLPEWAR
jgi:hypothetical protein